MALYENAAVSEVPRSGRKRPIFASKIAPYGQKRPVFEGHFFYLSATYTEFSWSDPKINQNYPKIVTYCIFYKKGVSTLQAGDTMELSP
jgi:hypothetical protein